jgi:hypothetical protein
MGPARTCGQRPVLCLWARSRGRTIKDKTQVSPDGGQHPPTQGHDRDMGTTQNTAAIYVRRSAVNTGNTEADAFSRSLAA